MLADIIVGLQYGDEGKGKVSLCLSKQEDINYDICLRFNGGPNAGHTVYHNGQKIVLHQIPCGIVNNKISIIGSGCVVDLGKLTHEIDALKKIGIPVESLLKIAYNTHVIYTKHINEDISKDVAGSTGSGIRPVNRDKYDRCGKRICDLDSNYLKGLIGDVMIIDPVYLLNKKDTMVLCEGAQGFELDIDYGNYPYVTSTHCCSGFVFNSGISPKSINKVYGAAKIYNTYVGNMQFQPEDDDLKKLAIIGEEFGSTTGRARQCNWMDLDRLKKAIMVNGVTDLIINKCDILKQLNVFKLIENNQIKQFNEWVDFKNYVTESLRDFVAAENIVYSENKDRI